MKVTFRFLLSLFVIILSSCSDIEFSDKTNEPEFKVDFSKFSLTVKDNTLIFDDLRSLQNCTDYLNQIGEVNYDSFEKAIGFESNRRLNKGMKHKYPTDLIATLFNPENKIIVNGKLLEISSDNDSVNIFSLDKEFQDCINQNELKLEKKMSVLSNVISEISEVENLKTAESNCPQQTESETLDDFQSPITLKSGNYNWVLWRVLEATISKGLNFNSVEIGLYLEGENFYRSGKDCLQLTLEEKHGTGLSYTISKSFWTLYAYNFNVNFFVFDEIYGNEGYRSSLSCNKSSCN